MTWPILLHLLFYASIIVFIAVVAIRFIRIQSMPLHVRWELYPVAHEPGKKAQYGGSYFENVDWWTKPQKSSKLNELRAMIPEMVFLVALFEKFGPLPMITVLLTTYVWIAYETFKQTHS